MTKEEIIKASTNAWMYEDQLNGTPAIGKTVFMNGLDAVVDKINYDEAHQCWNLHFKASEWKQIVSAKNVVKAIKDSLMVVK